MFGGSFYDWIQNRKIERIDVEARSSQRSYDDRIAVLTKRVKELEVRVGVFERMVSERLGISLDDVAAAVREAGPDAAPNVGVCTRCARTVPSRDGLCFYCGGRVTFNTTLGD